MCRQLWEMLTRVNEKKKERKEEKRKKKKKKRLRERRDKRMHGVFHKLSTNHPPWLYVPIVVYRAIQQGCVLAPCAFASIVVMIAPSPLGLNVGAATSFPI